MPTPVPGQTDVWNPVARFARLTAPLSARLRRGAPEVTRLHEHRGRLVAATATLAVLAGGTTAYAVAHKTVTLDVDGDVTRVSTFAGSVDGVLAEAGVDLGGRDTVAPAEPTALADGAEIVVRHARQVTVTVDGAETAVWTTALTADEALGTLATRGGDVRLVASRSASGGRAEIPLDLDGPVDVVVDGVTHTVAEPAGGVAGVLDGLGVTLTDLDRVSVRHSETGAVTVVVNRVVVQDVAEVHPIAFEAVEQEDGDRFVGTREVVTAGVEGQRTIVNRVTTVDGAETARELLSDAVTTEPVTEVTAVGTKKRPVAPRPAPVAAAAAPASPSAEGGEAAAEAPAPSGGGGLNWAALAACESGGRANAVSATGKYHGLYQFSVSTWAAVGGSGLPSQASAEEQTMRAQMLFDRSGAGQWPHCGPRLFR
ncbi:resuscitation-promoting factor [Cellulomonas aerilata]|uniref:G5 domain-containing protein n=1 Tax=Cellulomonas aerilata TaxID=515326 RepID=A0A512DDS2_9CELL|nr:resuscitation-promoting factor [Cellulomonas aerilata]GEO34621.1 hypothetical protein CAE01nite_23460 [Cellulomonas aerilata]